MVPARVGSGAFDPVAGHSASTGLSWGTAFGPPGKVWVLPERPVGCCPLPDVRFLTAYFSAIAAIEPDGTCATSRRAAAIAAMRTKLDG